MGHIMIRSLGKPESMLEGEWCSVVVPHRERTEVVVYVKCPECGNIDEIPPGDIDKGGKVSAEWKCPRTACPFEEWLTLHSFGEPIFDISDVHP